MELATQLDLLAQGQGIDQWGDILVLLVMAALWLIGALAKVITNKKKQTQEQKGPTAQPPAQRETLQQRLARKFKEIQEAAEAERGKEQERVRTQAQRAKPRPVRPSSPPAGEVTVRTDRRGDSVMVYERPTVGQEQQAAREREARAAVLAAGQEAGREPSLQLGPRDASRGPVMTASVAQPSALVDYSDPDALKKAILAYEILGKPLALREPPDSDSGF